jgi:hypothetical protein
MEGGQRLPVDEDHPIAPVDVHGINKTTGGCYHLLYGCVLAEVSFFSFWFGGVDFGDLVVALADRRVCPLRHRESRAPPNRSALAHADVLFVPEDCPLGAFSGYASREQRACQDAAFARVLRQKLGGVVADRQT